MLPILVGLCSAAIAVEIAVVFHVLEGRIVGINEELLEVRDNLVEAAREIINKVDRLENQIANSETVDPELLSGIKGLAETLANVVPDDVVEAAEEGAIEVAGEVPEDESGLGTDEVPVGDGTDEASTGR